jgi:putative copper resistance protein D
MRVIALWRFSRAGRIAVVVVLLTGVGNTAFVLGPRPDDWSSTYLLLLTLKVALVLAMAALAVVNRYVNVPQLSTNSQHAFNSIRSNSILEIWLGLTIVGLVAAFGTLDPS